MTHLELLLYLEIILVSGMFAFMGFVVVNAWLEANECMNDWDDANLDFLERTGFKDGNFLDGQDSDPELIQSHVMYLWKELLSRDLQDQVTPTQCCIRVCLTVIAGLPYTQCLGGYSALYNYPLQTHPLHRELADGSRHYQHSLARIC